MGFGSANAYRILLKCGYSPEEATMKSGYTPPPPPKVPMWVRARENEQKYANVVTAEDISRAKYDDRTTSHYDHIERDKPDTGDCTTRKGVYNRLKYGKGNVNRKRWLKAGFSEND